MQLTDSKGVLTLAAFHSSPDSAKKLIGASTELYSLDFMLEFCFK